eukprot:403349370
MSEQNAQYLHKTQISPCRASIDSHFPIALVDNIPSSSQRIQLKSKQIQRRGAPMPVLLYKQEIVESFDQENSSNNNQNLEQTYQDKKDSNIRHNNNNHQSSIAYTSLKPQTEMTTQSPYFRKQKNQFMNSLISHDQYDSSNGPQSLRLQRQDLSNGTNTFEVEQNQLILPSRGQNNNLKDSMFIRKPTHVYNMTITTATTNPNQILNKHQNDILQKAQNEFNQSDNSNFNKTDSNLIANTFHHNSDQTANVSLNNIQQNINQIDTTERAPVKLEINLAKLMRILNKMDEGDYEGDLDRKNNIRSGTGKCVYQDGSIYEGMWQQNMKHGIGVQSNYLDENQYTGYFYENLRDGEGELFMKDGRQLIAQWQKGVMHGKGKIKLRKQSDFTNVQCQSERYFMEQSPNSLDVFSNSSGIKDLVLTHRQKTTLKFDEWVDISPPLEAFEYLLENRPAVINLKINFQKSILAQQQIEEQMKDFRNQNIRDAYYQTKMEIGEVDKSLQKIQIYSGNFVGVNMQSDLYKVNDQKYKKKKQQIPLYCSKGIMWLGLFTGMSWIQRIIILKNLQEMECEITKFILS